MEIAAVVCRFVLASVFVAAGLAKLARRAEFEAAVRRYELLPPSLAGPVARLLPPFEVVCGLFLAAGLATRLVGAALALALGAFTVAVTITLLRGREIDCGCFTSASPRRVGWGVVVRNGVLLGCAAVVVAGGTQPLSLDGGQASLDADEALAVALAAIVGCAGAAVAVEANRLRRVAASFGRTL